MNADLQNLNKIYLLRVAEKSRNGVLLTKVGDTHREVEFQR